MSPPEGKCSSGSRVAERSASGSREYKKSPEWISIPVILRFVISRSNVHSRQSRNWVIACMAAVSSSPVVSMDTFLPSVG